MIKMSSRHAVADGRVSARWPQLSRAPQRTVAPPKDACVCGGGCPCCQGLREQMLVSASGEMLEREAEQAADRVMHQPAGPTGNGLGLGASGTPMPHAPLPSVAVASPVVPVAIREALRGSYRPLDAATRAFFEPRFGHDFGAVRVHTSEVSADSARALNAHAYTIGRDIVFGAGQYAPQTSAGRRLLAHELAHVVQQHRQSGPVRAMRQEAQDEGYRVNFDWLRCPREKCEGKEEGIRADLGRALYYTEEAMAAVTGESSGTTERLLDWYFNDYSDATVKTVRKNLECIQAAIQETLENDHYGCGIRTRAHAHTAGSGTVCKDSHAPVCLDPSYFTELSERERAEALVHECGHRVGLSSGTPDIYSHSPQFRRLDTAAALVNTDSYAMFIAAVVLGARATWRPFAGMGGGITSLGGGYMSLDLGVERQHPSWRGINPVGGISVALGDFGFVASAFLGARLADARPGTKGNVYLNLNGKLSLIAGDTDIGIGGEAQLGYRVGLFEIGLAGGLLHAPSREEGARTVYSGGLSFTFVPVKF